LISKTAPHHSYPLFLCDFVFLPWRSVARAQEGPLSQRAAGRTGIVGPAKIMAREQI